MSTTEKTFVPVTAREFLSTVIVDGKPLAIFPARGRFSTAANEALDKAHADGFVFLGEPGHPDTVVKAKREKRVTTGTPAVGQTAPAPAASSHPAAAPASFVAKDVRSWAQANGVEVGKRGRIHPNVIAAYVKANGKATGPKAAAPKPAVLPVRRETVGYAVEKGTLIAYTSCGSTAGKSSVGCNKAVSHCKCPTGPVAPHYLDAGIAGTPLSLTKPVA